MLNRFLILCISCIVFFNCSYRKHIFGTYVSNGSNDTLCLFPDSTYYYSNCYTNVCLNNHSHHFFSKHDPILCGMTSGSHYMSVGKLKYESGKKILVQNDSLLKILFGDDGKSIRIGADSLMVVHRVVHSTKFPAFEHDMVIKYKNHCILGLVNKMYKIK